MPFDQATLDRHSLNRDEYDRIVALLGREPNLTELGIFSVMWSEHCSYKSSRIHLKTLPTEGPRVLQGPGENAGAVDIGDGLAAVFKIESHNHPSFIEPYQGAATGVGGIIRDIFTMGARPLALLNALRFGPLERPQVRRTLEGVVAGIAGYGNSMGIPTIGGEINFDDSYTGNPLVNVLCLGIAKADEIIKGVAQGLGNPVYYVGAKTGRDGIHGATMASAEFDEKLDEKRPAVQVGDPFMEKLLLEACLEVMKSDALVGIQDMGAAGLTCSTCEMGARGGVGIEIDVQDVPQRESGMTPYEIMLSESQERMLLVVKKGREAEVERIFEKWDLHAVHIGEVTGDGLLRVKDHGTVVAEIPNKALADEAPLYNRPTREPDYLRDARVLDLSALSPQGPPTRTLLTLLGRPSIASKRWIYRQYDHMVRTNTLVLPGMGAGVIRVKGTARGLAMSVDGNGRFCYLDPFHGAQLVVAEAARNVACAGALPIGATNNLNFGNPEKPEIMWQLAQAVQGIGAACRALDIPITGGNVSLYNETDGRAILPSPVLGVVGVIEDASRAIGRAFGGRTGSSSQASDFGPDDVRGAGLQPGRRPSVIVLLGESYGELGGSEYVHALHGLLNGEPPRLDLDAERRLQRFLIDVVADGLLLSAHDCAEGGLAVTVAECCFDTGMGAEVDVPAAGVDHGLIAETTLFGESASRVVVSVEDGRADELLGRALAAGVPAAAIGRTGGTRLVMRVGGEAAIDVAIADAEHAWSSAIETYFARRTA
jgi:phosphoribosylformylglycinamidine synthase subunit PurL